MAEPFPRVGLFCASCKKVDARPMHQVAMDGYVINKHFECCARDGCPGEAPRHGLPESRCHVILRAAGGVAGDDLVRFLRDETARHAAARNGR